MHPPSFINCMSVLLCFPDDSWYFEKKDKIAIIIRKPGFLKIFDNLCRKGVVPEDFMTEVKNIANITI